MGNVVKAVFGKNTKEIKTEPLFQYDYGQILIIEGITLPTAYQVHFSNEPFGTSTTSIGGADGVEIPDAYLQTGADVYAWLFLQTGESDGRTVAMIRIPVKARAEITNDEPTPVQQGEIDQLIAELNDAVEAAEDSAEDAEDAAEDSADSAEDAEAWAQGTRGGVPVGSTDPAYQKNSKYYSEQAAQYDPDGKIDKVPAATSGNFASFTSGGGLQDSGKKASDFLTEHQDISGKTNLTVVAPAFAEGTANDAGSFVTYTDGKVYFLESGHTAGTSWENTTKAETNIGAQLGQLKSAITNCNNTLDGVLTTSENIFDGTFVKNEQVSTSNGSFVAGNGAMRTGHIAITSGVVTVGVQKDVVYQNKIIRCFCFYNSQKGKVESGLGSDYTVYTADDMKYQKIAVPTNAVYFAFDASMSHYENDNFYVSQEPYPDGYVPYSSTKNKVKPTSIKVDKHLSQNGLPADAKVVGDKVSKEEKAITAIRGGNLTTVKAASLAAGEGLYSVRSSIIRNKTLIFNAKVTGSDWSLVLAHGVVDNSYDSNGASGGYLVTPTTATIWVNGNNGESGTLGTAWTHGLTITDRLTVIISVDNEQKQTITLMSESGFATKSYTAQFNGRKGKVYAKAITGTFTNAELSFGCSDIEKPVWIFGDSYVSLVEERYPYWLQQAHFDNCLINSYAGEATPNAILDFRSLITMATPKYIVWGLGMNDHDTSSAVNADWMDGVNELIETCESAGITLILATIPNVVNTSCNNVKKNAWIAASGYRYVDFNKAIGAADEPGAAWPAGWLSSDNVHPTEMGARVLAGQIMLDVPELMMP